MIYATLFHSKRKVTLSVTTDTELEFSERSFCKKIISTSSFSFTLLFQVRFMMHDKNDGDSSYFITLRIF